MQRGIVNLQFGFERFQNDVVNLQCGFADVQNDAVNLQSDKTRLFCGRADFHKIQVCVIQGLTNFAFLQKLVRNHESNRA